MLLERLIADAVLGVIAAVGVYNVVKWLLWHHSDKSDK